jgi:hypothetical protein
LRVESQQRGKVISDQISAIRRQEKAYTEFAEKSGGEKPKSTDRSVWAIEKRGKKEGGMRGWRWEMN